MGEGEGIRGLIRCVRACAPVRLVAIGAGVLALACFDARATAARVSATDFQHTVWTAKDGAPADVWAITQTDDGWLWFGGTEGLSRFDGVRFQKVDLSRADSPLSTSISALYALRSGALIVAHLSGGVTLLQGRDVKQFDTPVTRRAGPVVDFAETRDGTIWASALNGLMRLDHGDWQAVGTEWNLPGGRMGSPFVDADDTLWTSTNKEIFFLRAGSHRFEPSGTRVDGAVEFLQTPDARVWYTDSNGTHLMPGLTPPTSPPGRLRKSFIALFDREGNYWNDWAHGGMAVPQSAVQDIRTLGTELKSLFQDRDGNLWIAEGLPAVHRLRRTGIVPVHAPSAKFATTLWPWANIAVDSHDRVWLAMMLSGSMTSPDDGLWRFDTDFRHVQADEIKSATAIDRDASGVVWIAGRQGVWKLREGRFEKAVELPEAARDMYVNGITAQCAGGLWVSVRGVGLLRHDGVAWHSENGSVSGLPAEPPMVQRCDAAGRLWLGYTDGTVATVENDRAVVFTGARGPQVGLVSALGGTRHTLVGGERGLALFRDGRFVKLDAGIAALEGATGIVETGDGDVWLNGARGAARIRATELDKPPESDRLGVRVELFDESDGYPGPATNLAGPHTTMTVGRDGRIWLTGMSGLATIDLARIAANAAAASDAASPPVVIESLDAGRPARDPAQGTKLSEGTRSLQIDYTALDYTHPDRLLFRYRLEGVDDAWVPAATRRQAFYSNLGPGSYRFVVNVTDANGTWTDSAASLDFVIPPTFVQSRLFLALCVVTVAVLLTLAYRINVRRVEARQRRLLEERLGERERIARELHDTLLQGTQALIFNLHVAVDAIPEASVAARRRLADALKEAEDAMIEGRDRIQDLRAGSDVRDLAESLADAGDELATGSEANFRLVVEGRERAMAPDAIDLAYRIGREAMLNAFRHANARSIDVYVVYSDESVLLRVQDDGGGIDEHAADGGSRPGHWGLAGMRERAEQFGASLEIWSRLGDGTEVELRIPATIAFRKAALRAGWLSRRWQAQGSTGR